MRRGGIGGATPTTYVTGYLYAGLGYTTVNEAAVPILSARHTHEELRDTPIVDKSCCVLMANNEILLDLIEEGELERAGHVAAWNIWAAKAYGVKAVNPGGVAAWKWGKDAKGLHEPVPGYSKVTPAMIISALAGIVDDLGLPHPLHLHCNNLGAPGNFTTTLETMKVLEGNRAAPGPPAVPRLRRRRLAHDALGVGRRSPRSSTPTRTSRPTPARCCSATR